MPVVPVGLARLTNVGLEEGCDSIADEGMQGLVGRVFAQGQHAHLGGDGLVSINHPRPLDEGQAEEESNIPHRHLQSAVSLLVQCLTRQKHMIFIYLRAIEYA